MTFTVKYRAKNGSFAEETVEAANRSDCFAQCKSRGIVPMSVRKGNGKVKSGGVGSDGANSKLQTSNSKLLLLVAGLAIVGAIAWLMLTKEVPQEKVEIKKERRTGLAKEVTPAKAAEPMSEPIKEGPPPAPKKISLRDPNLSEEQRTELYEKRLAETPLPPESTNRLFRTALEQVMGWVFTTELGDMPPPLPPIPDYDLVHLEEILNQKTTIHETDTDKQANEKDTVDYVKKELKKFIDKGGDPEDFLKYYHDELNSAYQERSMAQQQVMKIMQEDPAVAMEYMKEVNESLAGKGIKGVVLPERTLLRMGIDPKSLKGDKEE
ncbi:MAG: hypothetical protein IJV91_03145 [Kiritimatiellae bacterium]|nr:hypothetical protein [Kiritimatiellia bacterium]